MQKGKDESAYRVISKDVKDNGCGMQK